MEARITNVLSEIATLARIIEEQYPELQKYLDEERSTVPKGNIQNAEMEYEALEDYRDSLKEILEHYKANH